MTIEEIKQKLASRLAYVQKEIDYVKGDMGNVYKHQHYCGYLQGMDGTFGEKQFLTKLLAEIGEEQWATGNMNMTNS